MREWMNRYLEEIILSTVLLISISSLFFLAKTLPLETQLPIWLSIFAILISILTFWMSIARPPHVVVVNVEFIVVDNHTIDFDITLVNSSNSPVVCTNFNVKQKYGNYLLDFNQNIGFELNSWEVIRQTGCLKFSTIEVKHPISIEVIYNYFRGRRKVTGRYVYEMKEENKNVYEETSH